MSTVYLALGANLGDRAAALGAALDLLRESGQVTVDAVSSLYETAPMYVTDQPAFLNAVARVETPLVPEALLDLLKQVEVARGRVSRYRYGPREVDLDILLYDDLVLDTPRLSIPHMGLRERAFVLAPLAELAPRLTIPGTTDTVESLLPAARQAGAVRLVRDAGWYALNTPAE
ncbi:MAG TPA: 2-amino-4-hydroxy-6-hydroxymethyldihydropteridine diphosphokinase [Chloroflexota bacterium]|nr:2-amino-4-hydroxy-6-hydroxymethyldihydropteridine diphosphokinase [Chloroflexota bacterium]